MGWNNAVITNSGLSLIAQAVSGGTLTITSAGLGGGTVDTTALMAQTALTTPLTVPAVISAKGTLDNGLTVRVQIRNTGMTAAQRMKQVGLFAKLSDNDPVLFAIMQDDTGEEIPPAAEYPDFMIEFTAAVAVSNTDNIVVTISSSAVITRGALDEELKNYTKADQFNELSSTVSELSDSKADKASVEEALNGKSDTGHTHTVSNISDFPDSLPANGGRSDVANAAYHQVEHFLESGTDVLAYVTSDICPAPFNTIVRIMHSPTCPTNYGYSASDNDFFYHIFKLDNSWATVKAFDIRGNVEFINSCLNGTWTGWVRSADGGNADALDGLHAVSFLQNLGFWSTGSIKDLLLSSSTSGTVFINNTVSDMPVDNAYWFGFIDRKATNIIARVVSINNKARYSITYNGGLQTWYGWVNETDGGNADTANLAGSLSSTPTNVCLRNLSSGTADVTTTNCPSGAWYGKHS